MRGALAALALVVLAAGEAHADVTSLLGRRVTDVRLIADGQPVTDQAVVELIETRLGTPLRMADVRQTIDHFVTLGRYADVRVYGEAVGADAVHLRYEVVPVARAARLEIQGAARDDARTLRGDLLDRFGTEPAEARLPEISEVVRTYYRAHGFPAARVDLRTSLAGRPGRFALTIVVVPGRQTVVGAVSMDGPASVTAGLVDRLGLVRGRPLDTDTLDARVDQARDQIRSGGYYEAVLLVNVDEPAADTGAADVRVRVNLGDRVQVTFTGDPLPDDRRRALVPIERLRSIEEEVLEDASRNIEQHFRLEGYRAAAAPATRTRANGELRVTFAITRGPLHVLRKVETSGVVALPAVELEPLLKLREGEPYVDERIGAVAAALAEYYRVRGFAAVRVAPDVVIGGTAENGRVPVDVVFRIVEGARAIVRQVRIDGATAIPPAQLVAQLGLVAGKPFYRPQHVLDRETIERRYRNAGFQRATVTPAVTATEGDGVDLVYTVIEGPQTTVDHVLVTGSTRTDPDLIRREITLRPGAPLGYDAIIESQQRLSALGLFRRVRITEAPHGGAGRARDVVVEVEDAPATGVTYGGGLEIGPFARTSATGTATDKFGAAPRGFFQITRRNLFGKNRSISLFASASLRPTDPGVESGKGAQGGYGLNQYRVVGTFREPRAFGTAGDAQLSAFTERGIRSSFNFDRQGVRAEYARRFANRLTALGRYQYDFTTLFDTKIAVADRLLIDRLFPQVHLSSLFGSLLRDSRDDVLDPTRGTVLGSDLELALRALGSEVGFAKSFGQAFAYRRLPGPHNFVVAAGLRLGLARGFKRTVPRLDETGTAVVDAAGSPVVDVVVADLPASERFFAGGDSTVRGFALDRLGSSATLNADGFPTGGNGLVVMNAELRTPHVKGVGLVAFVDSGNVFLRAGDISASEFRTTAGLGLRYRSPLGPLRFDIGFKLDRRDFTGGSERRAVYHLSLGQAF